MWVCRKAFLKPLTLYLFREELLPDLIERGGLLIALLLTFSKFSTSQLLKDLGTLFHTEMREKGTVFADNYKEHWSLSNKIGL